MLSFCKWFTLSSHGIIHGEKRIVESPSTRGDDNDGSGGSGGGGGSIYIHTEYTRMPILYHRREIARFSPRAFLGTE